MNTSQNHLTLSKARSAFRLRPVGQGSDRALFRHSLIPFVSTLLAAPWALAEEPVVLPEVIVTAKPQYPSDAGYKAHRTTTATKTDTPIFDLPVSIQVVPEVVIDDQQAVDLKDILRNVSGVYSANLGGSSRFETFSVRGFEQTFIYRDGVRLPRFFGPRDTSNLERIEVLKGPAAVLYGRIEPGGLINMVPKRPLPEAHYSLEQEAGSFDFYRTRYSATGSLFSNRAAPEASVTPEVHPKDMGLYYRVDGAYTNANWFREFPEPFDGQSQDFERIFVSPRLKWEIDARTHAEIFFEYLDDARPFDRGLIALNGTARGLPIDLRLDDVHSNVEVEQFRGGMRWSHDLNEDWRLSNSFVGNFALDEDLRIQNRALQADGRTLQRQVRRRESEYEIYTSSLDLTGHFDVLGTKHNVLLGGDYYYDSELLLFAIGPDFPSIDIFRPVFGLPLPPIDPIEQVATTNTITKNEWYGIYFQDQIDILSDLHILGGGRYDWLSLQIDNRLTSLTTITDEGVFSPRIGILYQPWPWLSLYGNFVESVGLGGEGISASGKPFEPEFATQYEGGLKAEWFGGELSTTLAFYRLSKENILNPDPAHPGFSVQIGKARSQGIEIDMVGQLTAEWNVIASYAYIDAEVTEGRPSISGKSASQCAKTRR